jgi:hypothetical protein
MNNLQQSPKVVFMHGTWSSKKIWDHLDAELTREIPGIDAKTVEWSGANTAAARREGTNKFEEAMRSWDGPAIVICHSHAINCVLDASSRTKERLKTIFSLSGPVLSVQPFPLPKLLWAFLLFAMVLLAAMAAGAVAGVLLGLSNSNCGPICYLLVGAAAIIAGYLYYRAGPTPLAFVLLPMTFAGIVFEAYYASVLFPSHLVFGCNLAPLVDPERCRPDILPYVPGNTIVRSAILTGSFFFTVMVPVCVILALWSRRTTTVTARPDQVHAAKIVQVIRVDDEVLSILGLGMAFQRIVELLISAMVRASRWLSPVAIAFVVLLILAETLNYFYISAPLSWLDYVAGGVGAVLLPILMAIALALVAKVMIFGFGFGWDIGGLSVDHSIYVTEGTTSDDVELFTFDRVEGQLPLAHSVYNDPRVIELLKRRIKDQFLAVAQAPATPLGS